MQKIRSILKIGSSGVSLCDSFGASAGVGLELMLGTGCVLEFELRTETVGESAELPDYPPESLSQLAAYFALDFKCGNNSAPPLLILEGITVCRDDNGRTVLSVPVVNSAVEAVAAALKERSSLEVVCELGGMDGSGNTAFAWQFPAVIRSRVYLGDSTQTPEPPTLYYTAAQVNGLIAGLESQIGTFEAANIMVSGDAEYFPGENVETVLQTIGGQLAGVETELEGI